MANPFVQVVYVPRTGRTHTTCTSLWRWKHGHLLLGALHVLCCIGLRGHDAVDPLGVVGDDGVNAGLFHLATLLSSIGRDAHRDAIVEQRTPGVTLRERKRDCSGTPYSSGSSVPQF